MVLLVATEKLPSDTTCVNRVNFRAAHGRTHTEPNLAVRESCPVEPSPVWLVWNMVTERSGKWKLSDPHEPKNTWEIKLVKYGLYHGSLNFYGKGPYPLLYAGSRAARGKITSSYIPNRLQYCVIVITGLIYIIYKRCRGPHLTIWRAADCRPII
jgi:hypothetical protein